MEFAAPEEPHSMLSAQSLRFVEVRGLFGESDREFSLETDAPTIITGANGTGKSTILRLINAAANGDIHSLAIAPLSYMRLAFDQGPDFELYRDEARVTLIWGKNRDVLDTGESWRELPAWAVEALDSPELEGNQFSRSLMDLAQSNGVGGDEYRRVRDLITHSDGLQRLRVPAWMSDFGQGFPVLFVADQRLITEPSSSLNTRSSRPTKTSRRAIEAASISLAARLRDADSDYARSSQVADGNLAELLISRMSAARDVPQDEVQNLIRVVEERRKVLRAVGLLDNASSEELSVDEEQLTDPAVRRVVQVVLESALMKFGVLDDLEARLTAFKSFIDGRLALKSLRLDRKSGMQFELPGGRSVVPRELSSGEQQITVLAYEILFRAEPSTLVIVDEPEISLHVSWQDSLVDDLQRMGRASRVQFLLATHSPMILAGHQDLERSLSIDPDDRDA